MGDIPDFVSPIDGRVIHGRKGLREHNKEHNVTNIADYTETWEKAEKERERFFTDASNHSKERREALKHAYDKLERGRRK